MITPMKEQITQMEFSNLSWENRKRMARPVLINAVFDDSDKSMHNHVKVITKYYRKLCDIYDKKTAARTKK